MVFRVSYLMYDKLKLISRTMTNYYMAGFNINGKRGKNTFGSS